jgi:predicted RNase H-like HicB family nuclease
MEVDRYSVRIWWSSDDQAFLAKIPELPGCMADGSSPEQALRNVREVARIWIETARGNGRVIPEPQPETVAA